MHECGLIHSNISSHAVLVREAPFAAKLSSFELTTEILPREALGKIYLPKQVEDEDKNLMVNEPVDASLAEKYYKLSKSHFVNRTSLPKCSQPDDNDPRLPYSIAYRRMFSMHFYQPPELLIPSNNESFNYVLPSTRSDTFALALLLWESLNHCVPFVIFNHDELIHGFKKGDAKLPFLDKSSTAFMEIFDSCLRVNSSERLSDVSTFISMLDEVHRAGDGKKRALIIPEIFEPSIARQIETRNNFKNSKLSEKLPEKVYFTRSKVEAFDPQRRAENAITTENLISMGLKDSSRISESLKSSELEAHMASFSQQPGILHDDTLMRIKQTVEDQRVIAPKKPNRHKDDAPEIFEMSKRSLTDSTMYQSFFDFNRLHTPKIDKDVIYERTSTLKKRLKAPDAREQKKSVKGLFDRQPAYVFEQPPAQVIEKPSAQGFNNRLSDDLDKMNAELSQIVQDYDKNDFLNEIVQEMNDRQKSGLDDNGLSSFLNRGMTSNLHEQSRSFDELAIAKTPETLKIKRSESDNVGDSGAYRFAIGDYHLPKTPIARQNKIIRNAWLSDSKKPSGGRISNYGLKQNKSGNDLVITNNSPDSGVKANRKQYNVSIKIHHNDLDRAVKQKSNNVSQSDSSINIKLFSDNRENLSPLVKVNNIELNNSRYHEDINKKYYPMMPEMLSDVIQNKRDRSFAQLNLTENEEGVVLRRNIASNQEVEENVIVPVRTSVREAVKFIESTFKSPQVDASSPRSRTSIAPRGDLFTTPTVAHETTQTEMFFTPNGEFLKEENDDVSECLMQASDSIQKLNEIIQTHQPQSLSIVNKHLDNVMNPTPKKITTKVTVNMKKISRRSSDVPHLQQVQEQTRHSICNKAELMKRIQMHFKAKDSSLCAAKKNDTISASCSSLVPKDQNVELTPTGKFPKYFCRNCGFTMLPVEVLQKLKESGRLSIASSLAESLQSIKFDEGSQTMATKRTCHPITVISKA